MIPPYPLFQIVLKICRIILLVHKIFCVKRDFEKKKNAFVLKKNSSKNILGKLNFGSKNSNRNKLGIVG